MANKSYIISVSLGAGCYRHIRISADATLQDLNEAILDAVEFDDDHAHAFFMDNRMWSDADSYYAEGIDDAGRFTSEYTLDEIGLYAGKQFKYVFDFGDEWKFQCKVLKVLDEETEEPQVVKSVGDAPMQYGELDEGFEDDEDDEAGEYDEDDDEPESPVYPEIYDAETLKKLYAGLALPEETVKTLLQYFNAFSNLYAILPLRKALEIYNKQNEPVTEEDFAAFTEVVRHEEHYYSILGEDDMCNGCNEPCNPLDREIIADSELYIEDDYAKMKAEQEGKPYYVPGKPTLLKYADEGYFEQNAEFCALRDFLHNHMKLPAKRAEDVADELQLYASMAEQDNQQIFKDMARLGVKFKGIEEVKSFFALYTNMFNNTRMPINRGHTPNELHKDRGLDRKAGHEVKADGTSPLAQAGEVSRNALCPCGSGKKYKRCCGKLN